MADLLLCNGTLVHPDALRREDLLIRGETIAAVGTDLPAGPATTVLDCTDRLIFPGVIDPHTHMGIPIKNIHSADDFETGSRAALHGGITTIIDFTVLRRDESLTASVAERRRRAETAFTDYALHVNFTRFSPALLDEIPDLIQAGFTSFKVFTTYREAGMMLTYDQIREVARCLAEYGGLLMVHAEDDTVIQAATEPLVRQGHTEPYYHGLSRPAAAEKRACQQIIKIADETGCPVYIVHLSSAAGLTVLQDHPQVWLETCPQYLLLDEAVYHRDDGRMFVASPPLRQPADREALWQGVRNGSIHTIGTDHCPFLRKDKPEGIPFQEIPNGLGGVETLFPVLLAQFLERELELNRLTQLLCTHPARLFGLYPRKGVLETGADADVVIVKPDRTTRDWYHELQSITDWNAYTGFPALFPEHVFRRGEWVVQDGRIGSPSRGRFLPSRPGSPSLSGTRINADATDTRGSE
jgi:dihydropyrimidinase